MIGCCFVMAALTVTNMPPPYYGVYADAVGAPLEKQIEILAMPLRENVRGNSTYINTRRYLLGPDNPGFIMTPDGSGLGAKGRIDPVALEIQAKTTENAAEAARCRKLARWLGDATSVSPRAQIRVQTGEAIARAAKLSHPRVFATADDFAALKVKADTDALVRDGIARAISAVDKWLGKPPCAYELKGYQLLSVSRQAVGRLAALSFAYRMTGERKYVEDAIVELKAVCSFPNWNPRHTIDQGEMALAVATAYDWLYEALPADVREEVAVALEKHVLKADIPFAGWTRLQNNWVQVVSAGFTASAVALADRSPELCAAHLVAIVECLPEAESVCGPDGVYPEGPGYWNYGTSFNAICLDVMRTAFGHDFGLSDVKGFRETALYPALVTGPTGEWFNYSDSHGSSGSSSAVWWFARRFGITAAVTAREVACYRTFNADKERDLARTFPYTLFWIGSDLAESVADLPNVWVGQGEMPIGVVSADRCDPKASYLAIKGGSPSYNHGHADAGSFVLDLLGLRWAYDLGAENYREVEKAIGPSGLWSPEPGSKRWTIFRLGVQGHNTLMIGGQEQDPRGFATVKQEAGGVSVDLTSLYPKAKRVTRWVEATKNGARIVDTIEGVKPGTTVRWTMNTDAHIDVSDPKKAVLKKEEQTIIVSDIVTGEGVWSEGSAQPPNAWEQPNPGMKQLIYTAKVPEDGNLTLRVMIGLSQVTEGN